MASTTGAEVLPDTLQVHDTLPTSTAIKGAHYKVIEPLHSIGRQGNITFDITTNDNTFLDPYCTYVYTESLLRKGDTTGIAAGDGAGDTVLEQARVTTVNGLAYAWFNNVTAKINGVVIESLNNKYAYRGDIETRLSYPEETKNGHLKMMGFDEEDEAFNDIDANKLNKAYSLNAKNESVEQCEHLTRRHNACVNNRIIRLMGRIHSSIFDQPKCLPPKTKMSVTFEQNKEEFMLLSKNVNPAYWLEMQCMILIVRKIEVQDSVAEDILQVAAAGRNYLYPIRRVKMVQYNKGAGMEDLSQPNILPGEEELPRRIFIVLVHHESSQGAYGRDPFNYQPFGVKKVGLMIGGQAKPYPIFECKLRYPNPNLTFPLWGLLQTCQLFCGEHKLGINPDNYLERNCIFGWDLTTTQLPYGMCYETQGGEQINLKLSLHTAKPHPINIIIYAEYDAEIEISASNKVTIHENA